MKNTRTDQLFETLHSASATMKRTMPPSPKATKTKKRKIEIPDYHLTPSNLGEKGKIIWPAPADQVESARDFILEWFVPYLIIYLELSQSRVT